MILACRNAVKGKKALDEIRSFCPDAKVVVKMLDVSSLSSIADFCKEIEAEYSRVDILINNAGIIFHPFQKTTEGHELTTATNYLGTSFLKQRVMGVMSKILAGPFTLTHQLIPLLNKSENGRVINITALAHFVGKVDLNDLNNVKNFNLREVYASTKLCLVLFTKHMASLYKSTLFTLFGLQKNVLSLFTETNITFNSVSPGLVRGTDHLKNSVLCSSFITKIILWPFMWLFMKTPKQGCQTIVYAAVEPSLNNVSGVYLRYGDKCQ